jgi:LuxR family transcriptional regulator, maltose regulon positive regulatory protein
MPKPSLYTLIWSHQQQHYELHMHGQPEQCFRPGDDEAFSHWLNEHTAFAFWGQAGRLSILKEARPGGTGYWYAYRTQDRRTHKRYLGPSAKVTFARLEQEAQALSRSPSARREAPGREGKWRASSPQVEQRGALLSLRLSPPRLPGSLVERSRLLGELDAAFSHPLTLVSAAAGSGKTTLLSAWVATKPQVLEGVETKLRAERREAEPACAWLSLDEPDNDPIRFWLSVIAALRTCLPTCGEAARELLHSLHAPPLSTILAALFDELEQVDRDIILILDDYHVISDQAIHDSLLVFLDHPPANVHLVLSTRTNPELPLSRFRVRSQMIEIRDQDLRFTRQEAASFLLEEMDLPLSEEDVTTLSERTEGWIAGLQLAALSLRKQEDLSSFVKDFGGSHRYLLDYVQQEILARLPVPLQHFLFQTSIVTSMNAAVCQAVTARPTREECQQILEELERANLFVVPLDEQRQWYRFHELMRSALRARLQANQPDLVPLLHMRAASFYEAAGELREAIAHALAAPDYSLAASLMEQAAPAFWLSGEARTVHTWVFSLPNPVLRAHIHLALGAALRFVNSVNLGNETLYASMAAQVERTFTRLEEILRSKRELELSDAEGALIARRLRLLRALIEARAIIQRGDRERLRQLAQETEALPQDEEVGWNMIPLFLTFRLIAHLQGEGASLIPRLLAAKQQMMEAGDSLATIRVMTWLALAYTHAAQLHRAKLECLEGLTLAEHIGGRTFLSGYLYYQLFNVSLAWNRLEEAADWLKRLQRIAQDWQQVELLVRREICSAQLALARGDLETAQQALHKLEALVEQERFAYHAPWVIALRVQCWLAQGNLVQASEWAAQTTFSTDAWDPLRRGEVLMLVRVSLAQQQYARAAETLDRFSQHLDQPGDIQTALEWMALSVVALHQSGKREQALHVAARLLRQTSPEGIIRVYLDAGEPMKQVLLTWLAAARPAADEAPPDDDSCATAVSISRSYLSRLLATFEQEGTDAANRALSVDASFARTQEIQTLSPTSADMQRQGAEPLSRQEQRVLCLLVAGQTYAEIAEALIVSPNTMKTQVSSIYRKLGVSRRTEAIAKTSQLHLLSSK